MKAESEIFLKNFIRYRLAEYLKENYKEITISGTKDNYDLEFKGDKYSIRLTYPSLVSHAKKAKIWDFDLRNKSLENDTEPDVDYFILVGMEGKGPKRIFLLPYFDAPASHVRISIKGNSKYDNYEI